MSINKLNRRPTIDNRQPPVPMSISVRSVAFVSNTRKELTDDHWNDIISEITLADDIPSEAFDNIGGFSHLEIIFLFDKVPDEDILFAGRPRGNPAYPVTGIFAQRKKARPNRIGLCTVKLLAHEDRKLIVSGLDTINEIPVLDIKPTFKEFTAKGDILQPDWVSDLMKNYW